MQGEILSVETSKKIITLEKENNELFNIVDKFDFELNQQWQIIKSAYEYICLHFSTESIHVRTLKEILIQGIEENKNAQTI